MKRLSILLCVAALIGCGDDDGTPDGTVGGDTSASCGDLASTTAGLQTAEIKIGEYVVFFNGSDSAMDLSGSTLTLCDQPAYANLSDLAGGVTIPAKGYARIPWPTTDSNNDWPSEVSGGEFAIYEGRNFGDGEAIIDYFCWGDGGVGQRKDEAEEASSPKWSGDCLPAASSSSPIVRRANSAGTSAADYDVTGGTTGCTNP